MFKKFHAFVQGKLKHLSYSKIEVTHWNIYENGNEDLVVVCLRGSDGKEDYCVTLLGQWIFDSNFETALLLCKESLDLCCSSDTRKEEFVVVVSGRLFYDYHNQYSRKILLLNIILLLHEIYVLLNL